MPKKTKEEQQELMQALHEADEVGETMLRLYPRFWRALYERLVDEGFSAEQAFQILNTWITATCTMFRPS